MASRSIHLMIGEPRPRYSTFQPLGESGAYGYTYYWPTLYEAIDPIYQLTVVLQLSLPNPLKPVIVY